jgi:hypothetical protein
MIQSAESVVPETVRRVLQHSPEHWNQRIRQRSEERIASYAAAGPEAIERRLHELDAEWDIERALETSAASVGLLGSVLGLTSSRRWLLLPAAVGGFLLQHAIQGWCPPLEVFRRLGFRTAREIESERIALKALRGDFHEIEPVTESQTTQKAADALRAAEA